MKMTIAMMTFAINTHPNADPEALSRAAASTAPKGMSDLDRYCEALTDAVEALAPRIKVMGLFGKEKEVTQKEYVATWSEHAMQITLLTPSLSQKRFTSIKNEIIKAANAEFNRILETDKAAKPTEQQLKNKANTKEALYGKDKAAA